MWTVQTLVADAKADQRFTQLQGDKEPRLLRELSNAYRIARHLQATYLGYDQHSAVVEIPLDGSADYAIGNLGHIVYVEDAETWARVEPCEISARAIGWGAAYPTGRTLRVYYLPDYPDLIQGTAVAGSTSYMDLPEDPDIGVVDTGDGRYEKIKFETLAGTGAGQVLLATGYVGGSARRVSIRLEDGTVPEAVGADTVFCTFLGDLHQLIRPLVRDLALTLMTAAGDKSAIVEARLKSFLGTLGIKPEAGALSLGARKQHSGLFWRLSGRGRIQVLGQYGSTDGSWPIEITI